MLFPLQIGFVSTRFAGTDGVSLESAKWAHVLWDFECRSYWYAGKLDRDPSCSMLVPEAYFEHPENMAIQQQAFGQLRRSADLTRRIYNQADLLKRSLYDFVERFAKHRHPAVAMFGKRGDNFVERGRCWHGNNLATRNRYVVGVMFAEMQEIAQHLAFKRDKIALSCVRGTRFAFMFVNRLFNLGAERLVGVRSAKEDLDGTP